MNTELQSLLRSKPHRIQFGISPHVCIELLLFSGTVRTCNWKMRAKNSCDIQTFSLKAYNDGTVAS